MKSTLQADLKLMGLHRDVLKLLRCFEEAKNEAADVTKSWHLTELEAVRLYMSWILKEKAKYPTSLEQDRELLEYVTKETPNGKFHWMYQFVLEYRIG